MAKVDPKTGKVYSSARIEDISASVAANPVFEGRRYEFVGIDKIPAKMKQGNLGSIVDLSTCDSGSILRDTVNGTVHVPYSKKAFLDMMVGVGSQVSKSFSSKAYLEVSASMIAKFAPTADDVKFTYLVEEFYTGTPADFVGDVTSSIIYTTPDLNTASFSGIDEGSGYELAFNFANSNNVTNIIIDFAPGGANNQVASSTFISNFTHLFRNTGAVSSSAVIATSSFISPVSGTIIGKGTKIFVNGVNDNDGSYLKFLTKPRIAGDGDSGSAYTFLTSSEVVIYSASALSDGIRSGSFQYHATNINASTASSDFRTLFYLKGTNGPSGSFTGSQTQFIAQQSGGLGSLVHADSLLKTTASQGFYNLPGTTEVFIVKTTEALSSNFDNSGTVLGTLVEMEVPRFISKSTL